MVSIKYILAILLAVSLQGCGLTTREDRPNAETAGAGVQTGALSGVVYGLDGQPIDLAAGSSKIQVLMFVSETCSVCRAETLALAQDRATRGVPLNVEFLSVMVGAVAADAADWRDSLGVDWKVALDPNDPLFRSYCPQLQTPCLVLRNPFLNQYKTLIGAHPLSDWKKFTGAWDY